VTPADVVVLVGAGVLGGLSGSMAGLASLFSYPALLAIGLPAVGANVTNTVALTFASVGGTLGSRPELAGQAGRVRHLAVLAALGGAAGAVLLLATPAGSFELVVPFLIAGASVVLLLQPRLQRRLAGLAGPGRGRGPGGGPAPGPGPAVGVGWPTAAGIGAISVYGGYFGAGAGTLLLALLAVALPESLLRVNALKTVLLGMANGVAALGFAVFGPVDWRAAGPLALGLLAGSAAGPWLLRRLPETAVRTGVAVAGLGLAVRLLVDALG
jgi:hypothetical protein